MELTQIRNRIFVIRNQKVMLDFHLAELYEVETKALNLAVKRNGQRFPEDFMFSLTTEEWENLRFQIETSSHGGRRYYPKAFTEQGLAMLSGVLKSQKAIAVNISIMRAFVQLRRYTLQYDKIEDRLSSLEEKHTDVHKAILYLLGNEIEEDERKEIGY